METVFSPRPVEALILKLNGWSCDNIGEHFGVTRQRASQMVHQALNRLVKRPDDINLIPEELRDGIKDIVEERRVRGKRKQLSIRHAQSQSGYRRSQPRRRVRGGGKTA